MAESGDIAAVLLSGSTNGRGIKVAATATPGTLVHTEAGSGTTDYVTLWAVNTSASAVTLTLEWGGTTSPDDLIPVKLAPDRGLVTIVDKMPLDGALVVRAFAGSANVVNIFGRVDRWTD